MSNNVRELSKFRQYLIKHCKHLNTGNSPVFVSASLIVGIIIAIGGAVVAPKEAAGHISIGFGTIIAVVNAVQLIYKKYI